MSIRYLFIPVLTLLLAACGPTMDSSVKVKHSPASGASLEKLETFQWIPLRRTVDASSFDIGFLTSLKVAFTDAIEAKGYRRANEEASLLVALYLSRDGKIISSDWGLGYQWDKQAWEDYWMERKVSAKEVGEGTLMLDIFDSEKKDLVWSGTAQAMILPEASGDEMNERIDEAVAKLLATLPAP